MNIIKAEIFRAIVTKPLHFKICVYTPAHTHTEPYNSSASKGKQMMIGGSKSKTAFVDGYFEKKFNRIMEVMMYTNVHVNR